MSAYELMLAVIKTGKRTPERMLQMIDVYYAAGRLTDDEYQDLQERINAL